MLGKKTMQSERTEEDGGVEYHFSWNSLDRAASQNK